MKMGYAAGAIILLIFLFYIGLNSFLSSSVSDMVELLNSTDKLIENKDYEQAYTTYSRMKSKWEKSEKIFQLQLEHSELDNLKTLFAQIDSYFHTRRFDDYFEASYKLDFFINDLYKKNLIGLETIL